MAYQAQRQISGLLAILAILILPACQAENRLPAEERLVIQTDSDMKIVGTIYRPEETEPPWPGVLLLHMIYGQRQEWEGFARTLAKNGIAALAIDLRGHGETGGEMDWGLARQDLQLVWANFSARPEIDPGATAVVGASMGANMAVLLGADQPEIQALALLSPGLNYYMVQIAEPLAAYGERPVLIVASREDAYAASSSEELLKVAQGEAHLEMFEGISHGTQMLTNLPDLAPLLVEWLRSNLHSAP